LFPPTSLSRAVTRLGFVQADPIRAPARAQDLILRHRVRDYRACDLQRHYSNLEIEEDYFVNYGFMPRRHSALLHPRGNLTICAADLGPQATAILRTLEERGELHPREASVHDEHGRVVNYWGGTSRATTHLLDRMHHSGLLRIVRRDKGVRVYALSHRALSSEDPPSARQARADALLKLCIRLYAPVPVESLTQLLAMLRSALPGLKNELESAAGHTRDKFPNARLAGTLWYWPPGEDPGALSSDLPSSVRLLAPFDPVVWDRRRFEQFWGWAYRFEAYLPAAKRQRGYYALPLLWRDRVIGWGNLSMTKERLVAEVGYIKGVPPKDRLFRRELDAELDRLANFLR
jgi:uncharacterized protein YcaQ